MRQIADGGVLFVGGEYNQNNYAIPFAPSGLTNMSAVYDPRSDTWSMIAPPPGLPYIGDVPSVIMPDGRFVFGTKLDNKMWALDPVSLTWSQLPSAGKADNFSEEGRTLLPSGNLLTIDMVNTPHAEHYVPALGQWIADGVTPVGLTSPTDFPSGITYGPAPAQTVGGVNYGPGPTRTYFPPGEIGPAILRPDGTVFATRRRPDRLDTPQSTRPECWPQMPASGRGGRIFPMATTPEIQARLYSRTGTCSSRAIPALFTSSTV